MAPSRSDQTSAHTDTMSGIEVAGLVLGAFPLLIEAVKHYRATVSRKKLLRNLRLEKLIFDDVCLRHLEGLVDDRYVSNEQLHSLLQGEGWDIDIQGFLEHRMGIGAAALFIERVGEMHDAITRLRKTLGLDTHMNVCTLNVQATPRPLLSGVN